MSGDGQPQGSVTGRYELLSGIGKPAGERGYKRWNEVPIWYRVLDRFGLPTLFVLIMLFAGYRVAMYGVSVLDRQATALVSAMQAQVEATNRLTQKIEHIVEHDHEKPTERGK
jgi:hypothetical protein